MPPKSPLEELIAELVRRGVTLPPGRVFVDSFGDSPALSAELLELIRAGTKRAGASLLWAHEDERDPPPTVGDIGIVVSWEGAPAFVTLVVRCEVIPFDQVTAEFAWLEGEGDRTLAFWRDAHWAFFERECKRLGYKASAKMPVVCCEFQLAHVL